MIKNIMGAVCLGILMMGCSCDHHDEADRFLKNVIATVKKDPSTSEMFVKNPYVKKELEKAAVYFSNNYTITHSDYLMGVYDYAVCFEKVTILFDITQQSHGGCQSFYISGLAIEKSR